MTVKRIDFDNNVNELYDFLAPIDNSVNGYDLYVNFILNGERLQILVPEYGLTWKLFDFPYGTDQTRRINTQKSAILEYILDNYKGEFTKNKIAHLEYNFQVKITEKLLKEINDKLAKHHEQESNDSKNWGYVANINHVNEMLNEIINFLEGY